MLGKVTPSTVQVPSVLQPKSRPAMLTPAYVVFPLEVVVAVAVDVAEAAELATTAILEALRVDEAGIGDPVATPMAVEDGRTVDVAAGADESPEREDTAAVAAVKAELSVVLFVQGMVVKSGCSTAKKSKD